MCYIDSLKKAWSLYKDNFKKILIFVLIINLLSYGIMFISLIPVFKALLPLYLISQSKEMLSQFYSTFLLVIILTSMIWILLGQIIYFANYRFYKQVYKGKDIKIKEIFKESFYKSPDQILLMLFMAFIVVLSILPTVIHIIFIIIPILIGIRLIYLMFRYIETDNLADTIKEIKLKESWIKSFKLFLGLLIFGIILLLPAIALIFIPIKQIASLYIALFFTPMFMLASWIFYYEHL